MCECVFLWDHSHKVGKIAVYRCVVTKQEALTPVMSLVLYLSASVLGKGVGVGGVVHA